MEAVPILIIIGAPVLTSIGFRFAFTENILVRLLMVAALIYSIRFAKPASGPLFSLLVLLAIVTLLLERNHVVVASLDNQVKDSRIPKQNNLYKHQAPQDIFKHVEVTEVYADHESNHDAEVHLSDNIPDLKEGPSNHDSPEFYKSLGLVT